MVYIYKNFLILDRVEKIPEAAAMAVRLGAGFQDDGRIWHAKSPTDKIILVYKEPFRTDDTIKEYCSNSETDFRPQTFDGYIQIYCQITNVKVGNFNFNATAPLSKYWRMFKQFLVQSIKNSVNSLCTQRFTLYWDRKLCSQQFQNMIVACGLLTNKDKKTYVFQPRDMEEQKNNGWGTYTVSTGNGWGTNSMNSC